MIKWKQIRSKHDKSYITTQSTDRIDYILDPPHQYIYIYHAGIHYIQELFSHSRLKSLGNSDNRNGME